MKKPLKLSRDRLRLLFAKLVDGDHVFNLVGHGVEDSAPAPAPTTQTLVTKPAGEHTDFHLGRLHEALGAENYGAVPGIVKDVLASNPTPKHVAQFQDRHLGKLLRAIMWETPGNEAYLSPSKMAERRRNHQLLLGALTSFRKPFRLPDYLFPEEQGKRFSKKGLKELFSRLRSYPETQTTMEGVGQAQSQWQHSWGKTPYPSDDLLQAAKHFNAAGDPRGEILGWHADMMDGFKEDDPHFQHAGDTRNSRHLASGKVPLPDGSVLHAETLGHNSYPGVHSVSVSWTPNNSPHSYFSHWHPDDARGLADRFGEADPAVGEALHAVLDKGEDRAEGAQHFAKKKVTPKVTEPVKPATPTVVPVAELQTDPEADKRYLKWATETAPDHIKDYIETAEYNTPGEDNHFDPDHRRHFTVERLGAVYHDALKEDRPDIADHIEGLITAFGGRVVAGRAGEVTQFQPRWHSYSKPAPNGAPVTVVLPAIEGPSGSTARKGVVGDPPAGTKLSRTKKPLKFNTNSSHVTEADFHQHIAQNPEERTHALAYADWLEEQGKPEQANVIREHVNTWGSAVNRVFTGTSSGSRLPEVEVIPTAKNQGAVWVSKSLPPVPHPDSPSELVVPTLSWSSKNLPMREALERANRLAKEGSPVQVHEGVYYRGLQAAKNSKSQKATKFGAYKAPSGGVVVNKLFYPGGSLVPDLKKVEFAADSKPKGKGLKGKLRKIGKHLKSIYRVSLEETTGGEPLQSEENL